MTTLADLDATATADLAWFPSTSDVTGRPRCAKRALTPTNPVPWLAEGLLAFLPPDAQDRLLDNITALSAPGSR